MVDTLTITEQPAPIETVTPLKPSEALRLGRAMGMQYTPGYVEKDGRYCALGVIGQIMTGLPVQGYAVLGLRQTWAKLFMIPCRCPGTTPRGYHTPILYPTVPWGWDSVANIVTHLSDAHHPESFNVRGGYQREVWDDERIAGFLESIGR